MMEDKETGGKAGFLAFLGNDVGLNGGASLGMGRSEPSGHGGDREKTPQSHFGKLGG